MGDITAPNENDSLPKSEYPADVGDSTESENNPESEVQCGCETHPGRTWLDQVYTLTVDQIFTFMFTDSKFMADLLKTRKTNDMVMGSWQLDEETGDKTRQLNYILTLNNAMAKTAPSTDQQRQLKQSKEGKMYIICCEITNTGVPYCDAFSVQSRYCLTRVSSRECRIQLHSVVNYKKSLWGVVKSMIEKTALQGVQDFVKDLNIALKREEEQGQTPGKKKRRAREGAKVESPRTEKPALPSQSSITSSGPKAEVRTSGPTAELVIKVILVILGTLLILNGMLFYKLWALEDQTLQIVSTPITFDIPLDSTDQSSENLLHILRQQEGLHRAEVGKWKEMLTDVSKFLKMMENSLSDLKNKIDSYKGSGFTKPTSEIKVK